MSVGFGFSAGDFIAALELVTTVVTALRDSGGSSAEYKALVSQLYTLENALLRVKSLELDDSQHGEVVALRQAASQCQKTIDAFWEKIKKYQPSLRDGGSGSRVKDAWRKVKWAVCKKDDLVKFKADLMAHTESIELLLTTVQMAASRIVGKKSDENHRSLVGKVQDSYFGCMQRITVVMERVSTGIQQGQKLLEMTAKIIQTNVEIFKIVLDVQSFITRIPGQIDRQQPVYLVDALGRHRPFHLEFVTSAEALTYVLKDSFRAIGSGASKIENGEFAIQDSGTGSDINLALLWDTCFFPGQKVDMSMVFTTGKSSGPSTCPKCAYDSVSVAQVAGSSADVECPKCGMIYRRNELIDQESNIATTKPSLTTAEALNLDLLMSDVNRPKRKLLKRKAPPEEEEDQISLFKRVRINHRKALPETNQFTNLPISNQWVTGEIPASQLFSQSSSKILRCDECGYIPIGEERWRASNLRRHKRTQHSAKFKLYTCTYNGCGSQFSRKDNLRDHQRWKHDQNPPLSLNLHDDILAELAEIDATHPPSFGKRSLVDEYEAGMRKVKKWKETKAYGVGESSDQHSTDKQDENSNLLRQQGQQTLRESRGRSLSVSPKTRRRGSDVELDLEEELERALREDDFDLSSEDESAEEPEVEETEWASSAATFGGVPTPVHSQATIPFQHESQSLAWEKAPLDRGFVIPAMVASQDPENPNVLPNQGRVWPGMHRQEAALAKAQAQQKQQQQSTRSQRQDTVRGRQDQQRQPKKRVIFGVAPATTPFNELPIWSKLSKAQDASSQAS